ncbi:MAG: cellulase family glycosylhydrolase, partial [Oscillospiraceae bacterium]|nr:cellulase family glycosylhydrolase [Oscillospiraceae bacterium]
MISFRQKAGMTALAVTLSMFSCFSGFTAFAGNGAGGYSWEATSGYQEATDTVTDSSNATTVTYTNADDGSENPAGFCAVLNGEDWSSYSILSFTVTNHGSSPINLAAAINTGAGWDWHQSGNTTVDGNTSTQITLYLAAEEWTFDTQTCAVGNLHLVQRINLMVMAPWGSDPVSGSVTISDMTLGSSGTSAAEPKDGFYVDGTVLRDANQNAFEMRGTNYAYTWYKWEGNEEATLKELAEYGSNTVRIVLSNGVQYEKNSAGQVGNLIALCEKYKLIAVLEVHDVTGRDDANQLMSAANYFVEIASALIGHEDTTIINIANEWQGNANATAWQNAYIDAVKTIRDAGLKHCIMCDAGGWGQGWATVRDGGSAVLAADPENNCMFSVHMYGTAGGSEQKIKTCIDSIMARQLCLIIGEFGFDHSDGDVQEDYIMQYCDEVDIGWLSWSWYGNGSPVEYLDMSSANVGGTLSDWGKNVIYGTYGWEKTSELCSVYTGTVSSTTTTTTTTTDASGAVVKESQEVVKEEKADGSSTTTTTTVTESEKKTEK